MDSKYVSTSKKTSEELTLTITPSRPTMILPNQAAAISESDALTENISKFASITPLFGIPPYVPSSRLVVVNDLSAHCQRATIHLEYFSFLLIIEQSSRFWSENAHYTNSDDEEQGLSTYRTDDDPLAKYAVLALGFAQPTQRHLLQPSLKRRQFSPLSCRASIRDSLALLRHLTTAAAQFPPANVHLFYPTNAVCTLLITERAIVYFPTNLFAWRVSRESDLDLALKAARYEMLFFAAKAADMRKAEVTAQHSYRSRYHQGVSEERIPLRADTGDHEDDTNSSSAVELERSAIDPATYIVESQPLHRTVESQEI
ncbi:hypothetical protein DL96DRAFT_1717837 [Flagelloscypha sp. PMI_526]|nr:hypothetical protein DL96DRAFT_1717837 [Flagelloscypha sp. PMI_526]